ncbi:hypothetical protein L218DRAFT_950575 [Marasmius fiardii PR-910]|nr:hypothetical protein L218DRAFT_950575 [Marasmius fiardii PR-910]
MIRTSSFVGVEFLKGTSFHSPSYKDLHNSMHHLIAAPLVLLLWDYLLTLAQEQRPKGWITLLFIMNRYFSLGIQVTDMLTTSKILNVPHPSALCSFVRPFSHPNISSDQELRYHHMELLVVVGVFGKDGEGFDDLVLLPGCFSSQVFNVWAVWFPIIFYETITLALVSRQFYSHCLLKHEHNRIQLPLMQLVIKETLVASTGAFTSIVMVMLSTVGNRMLFSLRQEVTGDWSITGGYSHTSALQFHVPESMMATSTHQSSEEGVEYRSQI